MSKIVSEAVRGELSGRITSMQDCPLCKKRNDIWVRVQVLSVKSADKEQAQLAAKDAEIAAYKEVFRVSLILLPLIKKGSQAGYARDVERLINKALAGGKE
jgi:hypothetical protein